VQRRPGAQRSRCSSGWRLDLDGLRPLAAALILLVAAGVAGFTVHRVVERGVAENATR
jgi:hypothetical protein